ncbi:MAG: thiamine phosphate synthase, partial [Deltaproteobacteria bacterium]|nr:thiamine phosphate synthase [Deltaproteobacteria bacterium]
MLRGFYAICDVNLAETASVGLKAKVIARTEVLLGAAPCMLQLRAKHAPAEVLWQLAAAVRPLCAEAGVPFCVNDRLDVALAVGADAVHLGQDDLPLHAAIAVRDRGGRPLSIGISTHNEAQAAAACAGGADYIGFGPLFATHTKENPDPVVGLARLAAVVKEATVPVVGIGGVTLETVVAVAATGAAAAAVISAVAKHAKPAAAGALVNRAFGIEAP